MQILMELFSTNFFTEKNKSFDLLYLGRRKGNPIADYVDKSVSCND